MKNKQIEHILKKIKPYINKAKPYINKIKPYLNKVKPYLNKINPYIKKINPYIKKYYNSATNFIDRIKNYLKSKITAWWQIILIILFCVIFLYYPLGGLIIHEIDTSTSYQPQTSDGRLASIDTMSHLINREVHHKLWTPNLPFLFPSYILDNMPSFQLGIMSAVSQTARAFDSLTYENASDISRKALSEGTKLLQYQGNIWLFSPQNKLLPVTSSNTQYKKGRKQYNILNREIANQKTILNRSAENLELILLVIKKDLEKNINKTEEHIRENSSVWIDLHADEIFYHEKGKLYAYSLILRDLSYDFKDAMIRYDIYQQWTSMLNYLNKASILDPFVIRNANPQSSFAPNHLITLNYLASRSLDNLNNIITKLNTITDAKQ